MGSELNRLRYKAPDDLRANLIKIATMDETKKIDFNFSSKSWLVVLTGAAAILCLIFWSSLDRGMSGEDVLRQEIVSSHIRSMMEDNIYDIASTDSHTVKPWFGGRLDYSPKFVDLKSSGFPLIGGRLDYAEGRPVAALVYKKDQHVINLFTWPSNQESQKPVFFTSKGFNIWCWEKKGMIYYAVSDLNANTLKDFMDFLNSADN